MRSLTVCTSVRGPILEISSRETTNGFAAEESLKRHSWPHWQIVTLTDYLNTWKWNFIGRISQSTLHRCQNSLIQQCFANSQWDRQCEKKPGERDNVLLESTCVYNCQYVRTLRQPEKKLLLPECGERERESECPAGKSKQAILKTVIEDSVASGLAGWQAGRLAGRLAARAGAARI